MTYPPQQPGPQQPDVPPPGQPQQPGAYPPPPGYPVPQPAPAKKGMGTGKILLLVFAGLVGLCCVGGIISVAVNVGKSPSSTSDKQAAATEPTGAARTAAAAPTQAGQAKPAHPKLGQPARDGKFEFTVQKVDCGKTKVGDDFLNKTAQGQFCLVTVAVKNIGNEPRTFNGGSQKASGAGGVQYTNDGAAELYANKDSQTFLNDINPGNQVTGVLVFDIAQGAAIKSLELHDSPFSGGVTVDLA